MNCVCVCEREMREKGVHLSSDDVWECDIYCRINQSLLLYCTVEADDCISYIYIIYNNPEEIVLGDERLLHYQLA
jgi:hypothetical protein